MGYFGFASRRDYGSNIALRPDQITERLVAHELGHAFVNRFYERSGNKYTYLNPEMMLNTFGIYADADTKITGQYTDDGQYDRYAGEFARANGYCSDSYADQCQYHSRDVGGWRDAGEDFADMFMNWAYGSFEANVAGRTLNNWMNTFMPIWMNH